MAMHLFSPEEIRSFRLTLQWGTAILTTLAIIAAIYFISSGAFMLLSISLVICVTGFVIFGLIYYRLVYLNQRSF